jgi:hypothetical protein
MNTGAIDSGRAMRVSLALIAILALVIVGLSGPPAGASGGNTASAAKKKCKKGFKLVKKHGKKKCKKKPAPVVVPPVVRATLTWTGAGSTDADLDLFVFDNNGQRAGNGSDAIPSSTLSPDVQGVAGTETFTDLSFTPTPRQFSFGVCYTVGGSVHAPFTLTYVTADGVTHTESRDPGSSFHYDFPVTGGPTVPTFCPN